MQLSMKTLFAMEDRVLKMPGLYAMWTVLFLSNLVVLGTDTTQGASRDFNLYTTALSTIYCSLASYNTIYGNKKPSSMLLMAGPVHQYTFWLLLAYYRGLVYGTHSLGVMNVIQTVLVSLFNLDLLIKTWILAVHPEKYEHYLLEEADSDDEGGGSGAVHLNCAGSCSQEVTAVTEEGVPRNLHVSREVCDNDE